MINQPLVSHVTTRECTMNQRLVNPGMNHTTQPCYYESLMNHQITNSQPCQSTSINIWPTMNQPWGFLPFSTSLSLCDILVSPGPLSCLAKARVCQRRILPQACTIRQSLISHWSTYKHQWPIANRPWISHSSTFSRPWIHESSITNYKPVMNSDRWSAIDQQTTANQAWFRHYSTINRPLIITSAS